MTTLAEFKLEVIRLLGEEQGSIDPDPVSGTNTTAELLLDSCRAALLALSSRYWKAAELEVAASDTETDITLPGDLVEVEGVYDASLPAFIPKVWFRVGSSLTGSDERAWMDYPTGTLKLTLPMVDGGKVFYSAHWALPTEDDDVLEPPNLCLTFLLFYATSYCQLKNANAQAELRQFGTKVDAGTPVMLPAKDMSDYFAKRADIELQRLPMKQKGIV